MLRMSDQPPAPEEPAATDPGTADPGPADQDADTAPLPAQPQAAPRPEPAASPSQVPAWRDRVLGLRGIVAVAIASLIVGGLGGFALGRIGDQDDEWRRGGMGWHHGPGGMPDRGEQGRGPHQGPPGWGPQQGWGPAEQWGPPEGWGSPQGPSAERGPSAGSSPSSQ